ncbi:AraC family transcriptional regulator [Pedobacter antarcticus]|uniref:AraC family transcriptional regulator n=1 Tax=Pedobacter antarcticus TaxID=34086 RepID=UPI001C579EB4|nr:AraC family transcriptional regulator [Pedobacter antarcticus]
MSSSITAVQTCTFAQLLEAVGASDQNAEISICSTTGLEMEIPIRYPFRSDHFSFLILQEGEFKTKVNLTPYTVTKNEILLITPNDVRQFEDFSSDCIIKFVGFKAEYLYAAGIHKKNVDALTFFSSLLNPVLRLGSGEMENIARILDVLEYKSTLPSTSEYRDDIMLNLFSGFIYELALHFRLSQSLEEIRVTRKEELVMRFLKLLPTQFRSVRSVQVYAEMLNVSPKYLSQTLKDISGKTAGDFIGEMLLLEAKILLNHPELSIAEVSNHLNFSDQFSFSNYFKKHTGKSPTLYRKS